MSPGPDIVCALWSSQRFTSAIDDLKRAVKLHGSSSSDAAHTHALLGSMLLERGQADLEVNPRTREAREAGLQMIRRAVEPLTLACGMITQREEERRLDPVQTKGGYCASKGQAMYALVQELQKQEHAAEAIDVCDAFFQDPSVWKFGDNGTSLKLSRTALDLMIAYGREKGEKALRIARKIWLLKPAREDAMLLHYLSYIFKDNWKLDEMGQVLERKLTLNPNPNPNPKPDPNPDPDPNPNPNPNPK